MWPCKEADVIIVGAGPAGASAAKVIAEQGYKVLVLERKKQVGIPVQCAEFVPKWIYRFCSLPKKAIAQEVAMMETVLPDGTKHLISSPGFMLNREVFEKHLIDMALEKGANLALDTTVKGINSSQVEAISKGERLKLKAKIIIGADGSNSIVRKCLELGKLPVAHGFQARVTLKEPSEKTIILFHSDFWGGYGWLFPKGKTANVGLGMILQGERNLKRGWQTLCKLLGIKKEDILGYTGGSIPIGGLLGDPVQGSVLLAGDAAGLTHPITGAGILNAVISGTIAGQVVSRSLNANDCKLLNCYRQEIEAYFSRSLDLALLNRKYQEMNWTDSKDILSQVIKNSWIAFKGYGQRVKEG
jgi:digeranylgeranylglycerophospholipid reductase